MFKPTDLNNSEWENPFPYYPDTDRSEPKEEIISARRRISKYFHTPHPKKFAKKGPKPEGTTLYDLRFSLKEDANIFSEIRKATHMKRLDIFKMLANQFSKSWQSVSNRYHLLCRQENIPIEEILWISEMNTEASSLFKIAFFKKGAMISPIDDKNLYEFPGFVEQIRNILSASVDFMSGMETFKGKKLSRGLDASVSQNGQQIMQNRIKEVIEAMNKQKMHLEDQLESEDQESTVEISRFENKAFSMSYLGHNSNKKNIFGKMEIRELISMIQNLSISENKLRIACIVNRLEELIQKTSPRNFQTRNGN